MGSLNLITLGTLRTLEWGLFNVMHCWWLSGQSAYLQLRIEILPFENWNLTFCQISPLLTPDQTSKLLESLFVFLPFRTSECRDDSDEGATVQLGAMDITAGAARPLGARSVMTLAGPPNVWVSPLALPLVFILTTANGSDLLNWSKSIKFLQLMVTET